MQLLQMQICVFAPEWNLHIVSTVKHEGRRGEGKERKKSAQRWRQLSDKDSWKSLSLFVVLCPCMQIATASKTSPVN